MRLPGTNKGDVYLGYDPGGNDAHGVAALSLSEGGVPAVEVATLATAEDAVAWLADRLPTDDGVRAAIGIDALTVWATGRAGWRPADDWLRATYPEVRNSVAAPNSLRGAMAINGMLALVGLRETNPNLIVSETHPKVLHFALTGRKHAFAAAGAQMAKTLCGWIGVQDVAMDEKHDHEWDALVSAYAVRQGVVGAWRDDLHTRPVREGESLVRPAGASHFFWPPSS